MADQTVAEWLAQGHTITKGPTIHLVRSQHPDEPQKTISPVAKPKRTGGGGWGKYWAKRRAMMGATNG